MNFLTAGAAAFAVITPLYGILAFLFFSKNCRLRLAKPHHMWRGIQKTVTIGFSAGILDLGIVVIAILMNNQIRRYGSLEEFAVYGVVASVGALFQALLVGISHAIQPLVSANFGEKNMGRTKIFGEMSLATSFVFGVLFTCIGEFFPVQLVCLFVNATPEVIAAAPLIVRLCYVIYPFLGITILATYYLQSLMCDGASLLVALPVSEWSVAAIALRIIRKKNRELLRSS